MDPPLAARLDGKRSRGRLITRRGMPMGVADGSSVRVLPSSSSLLPPCVRTRAAFTDTLLLYNYTLRCAISYKLAYVCGRARTSEDILRSNASARTRAAFTCGAAILITRLSSGGKHKFRSSVSLFFFSPDRYRSVVTSWLR